MFLKICKRGDRPHYLSSLKLVEKSTLLMIDRNDPPGVKLEEADASAQLLHRYLLTIMMYLKELEENEE